MSNSASLRFWLIGARPTLPVHHGMFRHKSLITREPQDLFSLLFIIVLNLFKKNIPYWNDAYDL